ncbi:MAG: serine/threonine-protein kinase, partial [Planctomycetota bacterium]
HLPAARTIYVLRQVCAALEEAHAVGLVHRDIKPLNIMLCRRGTQADLVKVLDFGLVKDIATPEELQLTAPNLVGGTPPYIGPERLKDPRSVDPRSDLFSVGAVAFALLTGKELFGGSSAMEICDKILHTPTPSPSSAVEGADIWIPPALDELVLDLLAKSPDQRPESAGTVIDRLDSIELDTTWDQKKARAWWIENEQRILDRFGPPPTIDTATRSS